MPCWTLWPGSGSPGDARPVILKLLVIISSLDLRAPLGATPSLWQLLKALAEQGVELVVAPYQGRAIESPWWAAADNPCHREGDTVAAIKRGVPARRMSKPTKRDCVSAPVI